MCGIAVHFNYGGGRVDREALLRTRDYMASRGPDAEGVWLNEDARIGLAHRRLSIVDLSEAGAQPMHSRDGTLAVSFNGEIYNYPALRRRLEQDGHRFRSDCDTEVLLHLYNETGAAMTDDLRGMYAFALWDEERQGLLLARDSYGIKPLYYADDGQSIQVASQVKALRAAGGLDTRPDPAGHVGFFLFGHVPEPHTLYRGIRALPAGHTLWIDDDGPRRPVAFGRIPQMLAHAEDKASALSLEDAQIRLRNALTDSVRHHLMADVEVGLFLSAGLDSATLAALLAEQDAPLHTVTLGFEEYRGTREDEVPLAEKIAARYGAEHETVWVTQSDFEAAHDDLMVAMDQPTIDGANTYFVSRAAAAAGLKVALSGLGGDELFGGYPSFQQIPPLVGALGNVPGIQTVGRGLRVASAPVLKRFTSPKYAGLLEYGTDYGGAYLLRRGLFMPWELPDVLDADLAREGWDALKPRLRVNATADGPSADHLKVSAMESTWYMRNQLLRDTDWTSMAHSLEVRTPFVDEQLLREVAPLLAACPELGKRDMAATPVRSLPEKVLQRQKTGFTVPVRQWLLNSQNVNGTSSAPSDAERGLRGWARYVYDRYWRKGAR
jgi:asparagine synthase (glutamine-hydrolysing)